MTTAVCFKCGEIKYGAFNVCTGCNSEPITEDDFVLSLVMTDHYFGINELRKMSYDIKSGKELLLSNETRGYLSKSIGGLPLSLQNSSVKVFQKWWRFRRKAQ